MKPNPGRLLIALMLAAALAGCQSPTRRTIAATGPSMVGLSSPREVDPVEAICTPPLGWKPEPLKHSGRHDHQVWLSPSGHTAYGVIHFSLPLPVNADFVLPFFLREMKKSEGEAILLSKEADAALPGVRFVAEGGLYKMRSNLIVRGWQGWAIYAGTLRKEAINPSELELAERARDNTRIGTAQETSGVE
ncbi:MAG: hypothetical protein IT446_07935 [Phycisphaerales bacterium]|nr:hypothetical protein [Phycisphaerales bacterium]